MLIDGMKDGQLIGVIGAGFGGNKKQNRLTRKI